MSEKPTETAPKRALVLLAPGAEEMEVVIVTDVLRRGGIEVVLAGLDGMGPFVCSRGLTLVPDEELTVSLVEREIFDLVVLPGGLGGAEALAGSGLVGRLLHGQHQSGRLVAAICAAPLALVRHGLFAGEPMTSHLSVRDQVSGHGVWTAARVVETDGLITSMGPGTAFEFSLALVGNLCGPAVAESLRAPMVLD